MAYAIVTAFVLLGAINSQNNLLFWALGLAIGGLLASGFVSGVSLMGISLEREPVSEATAHRPFALRYRVRNRSRLMPAYALLIEELPPKGVSRSDWARVGRPMASLGRLSPRRTVRCQPSGLIAQRGPFELGRVRVSTTFPFGVARKSVTFDLPQPALATPQVHRLRSNVVETILEPTHDGTEAIASPGAGEDFYGVREYRLGDRVRDVRWRRSARSDTLVVTQRSARSPRRLVLHLELDPAVAAERDARAEQLLSLAASLVTEAGRRAIAVSLAAPESGITSGAMTTPVGRAGLLRTLGAYGFVDAASPEGRPPEARFGAVVLTLTGRANAGGIRTFTGDDLARLRAEPEQAPAGITR